MEGSPYDVKFMVQLEKENLRNLSSLKESSSQQGRTFGAAD